MLQGGFGDFCFYEIASAVDGFGFDETTRGCGGIMTILTRWDSWSYKKKIDAQYVLYLQTVYYISQQYIVLQSNKMFLYVFS